MRVRTELLVKREAEYSRTKTVIYAVNHSNSMDVPLACRAAGRHCWVLAGKQQLYLSDRLFFWLNGTIWVDRKDKTDMQRAKQKMLRHLAKRHSLLFFPEGTWNLSDNLLMLPMKWGIIDCAKQAGVPIVPLILDYGEDNLQCKAWVGEEISVKNLSLSEGVATLRDTMAEMRYKLWEIKGVHIRKELNREAEQRKLYQAVLDYPPMDWEYEKSVIFDIQM